MVVPARAAQNDLPTLRIEGVYGDYVVWAQDPGEDGWRLLPLPQGTQADMLEGATIQATRGLLTVVSADGDALLVYVHGVPLRENQDAENPVSIDPLLLYDKGVLRLVPNNRLRFPDGAWMRWQDDRWVEEGPPAGSDDPLSQAVQAFLNQYMTPLHLHYAVVLADARDESRSLLQARNARYYIGQAVLPISQAQDGPRLAPLLIQLDENDTVTAVTILVSHAGPQPTTGPFSGYSVSELFDGYTYDSAAGQPVAQGPVLARFRLVDYRVAVSGVIAPLTSESNWHRSRLSRIVHLKDAARGEDVEGASLLQPTTIVAQTQPGAYQLPNRLGLPVRELLDGCPEDRPEWTESRTAHFALIYPTANADMASLFFLLFGEALEHDYQRQSQLFDTSLPLPVHIQIYPSRHLFACLNERAPLPPPTRFHDRIGNREIVLLADEFDIHQAQSHEKLLNALRYEMASFFVAQVTGERAPPGLLGGVATYAMDPRTLVAHVKGDHTEAPVSWRYLWEEPFVAQNHVFGADAMTIVAHLVDVYGWPAFLELLQTLATTPSYGEALLEVYQVEPVGLQAQWQRYYPAYFAERWRSNVFFDVTLEEFETLLRAGAYADAAAELKEMIALLETIGDAEGIVQAEAMLAEARRGQEAGALLGQSRQALLDKEYASAITLADEAEQIYQALGDERRLPEVAAYRARAQEVLALRAELATMQPDTVDRTRLLAVGERLDALGDGESVGQVEAWLEAENSRQEAMILGRGDQVLLLLVALVAVRFIFLLLRRPLESKLL